MTKTISFDASKYRRLKSAYELAKYCNSDEFEFDGQTYLTSYARYVLEYLKSKLKEE
jgi:hypothetical protein